MTKDLLHLPEHDLERLYHAGHISDDELEQIALARVSPADLAMIDGIAYGIAKLLNTPIDELAAEAAEYRTMHESPIIGAVPLRDQLAHLDQIVNAHEDYWSSLAQHNPRSTVMRDFLRRHWDPWLTSWMDIRPRLDRQSDSAIDPILRGAARALTGLREIAADRFIPTPDLGTSQHGFVNPEPPHVAGEGDRDMTYAIGADGHSYSDVAAHAVMSTAQHNPSPAYGYVRSGAHQKIYLFHTVPDAHDWFTTLIHGPAQPHDYAAVFAMPDLSQPVTGLEDYGHAAVSGDAYVGNWLPFLLGLPLGGAGGYYLRKWQEGHPGELAPGLNKLLAAVRPAPIASGDPDAYAIGDWIGAYQYPSAARRDHRSVSDAGRAPHTWPQTKALIDSAIRDVQDAHSQAAAEAYVWSLDPPGPSSYPGVELTGTTAIVPFSTHAAALDYMRERNQTPHVALALFDTKSHWPNPTNWTKSDDPAHEPYIAQQIAKYQGTRTAGDYDTTIGAAIDDVRRRAQSLADRRAGSVVGVIHTVKDGLWHSIAFHSSDDADDWLGTATHDPASFTYAAYYDKDDFSWPHPVNEKIGGHATVRPRLAA